MNLHDPGFLQTSDLTLFPVGDVAEARGGKRVC